MNNINRVLVKSQAKKIISEKIFVLFIVSAVALMLTNGLSVFMEIKDNYNDIKNRDFYSDNNGSDLKDYGDYYDYFNQFPDGSGSQNSSDNPLENFGKNAPQGYTPNNAGIAGDIFETAGSKIESVSFFAGVLFSPLYVTLCGFYIMLIRKNPEEELKLGAELKNLFSKSYDSTFLKKLLVYFLRNLFIGLWCILLVIPGIIYSYSTYFAFQLMNDYPNLKPTEALKLSKKIIRGNRSELFWLDVSFIPWFILCAITCGIASIYVIPYYFTTKALYYENFRLRAVAEGRVNENDFLSAEEIAGRYASANNQGSYYSPMGEQESQNYYQQGDNQQNYYYQPQQPNQEAGNPVENNYSYAQPQGDGVSGEYAEGELDSYFATGEHQENSDNQEF